MIARIHLQQLRKKLRSYPAVALLGPRQCGKTTLARQLGGAYFDLETPGDQIRLDAVWDDLIDRNRLVILDEAQCMPEIFPRLRGAIDAQRKRQGRFLLLGSVSPDLLTAVSESLAGRLGFVKMSPFILPEFKASQQDDLWLRGGYPDGGILGNKMFPQWQHDYLLALSSRDLPTWGMPGTPQQTMRLMNMLAVSHGQLHNGSQLSAALGRDRKTITGYCDRLEGAFLIRRLQPYFANVKKRLVKSPRIYWRDSGLLHALMGIQSNEQLYHQPWIGHSWEGFVIEQTLATLDARGIHMQSYFFRTSDGYELDLVLDFGTERWAIEVKLTSSPSTGQMDRLNRTADFVGAKRRILVCRIARRIETKQLLVINLWGWLKKLMALK